MLTFSKDRCILADNWLWRSNKQIWVFVEFFLFGLVFVSFGLLFVFWGFLFFKQEHKFARVGIEIRFELAYTQTSSDTFLSLFYADGI